MAHAAGDFFHDISVAVCAERRDPCLQEFRLRGTMRVMARIALAAAYRLRNPKAKSGDFEKNRETFKQTFLAEKQRDAITAYVREIQNRTKITIDDKSMAL